MKRWIRLLAGLLLIAAVSSSLQAREVTQLDYLADARGLSAGTVQVRVIREGERYEIHGEAEATGVFELLSAWRSWFRVSGRTTSGLPVAHFYEHFESNRSRTKTVKVIDGVTEYARNGEARAATQATALIDVFSLIFVHGQCDEAFRAHSGRMGYDIVRTSRKVTESRETCVYSVLDDEDVRFNAIILIENVSGVRAPVELDFSGYQLGRFRLQDVMTEE